MTLSPDGLWWWNGTQWVSALSPDGRWRWDGERWNLNAHRDVPVQQRLVLIPTRDTQPLQTAVLAYLLISTVVNVYLIATREPSLLQSLPSFQSDTPAGQAALDAIVRASVAGGITGIVLWNALLVAGTWFRWRWAYYVIMVLGLLSVFGALGDGILLALNSQSGGALNEFIGVLSGLAYFGIAIWMLRLRRERGTAWAMRHLNVAI